MACDDLPRKDQRFNKRRPIGFSDLEIQFSSWLSFGDQKFTKRSVPLWELIFEAGKPNPGDVLEWFGRPNVEVTSKQMSACQSAGD